MVESNILILMLVKWIVCTVLPENHHAFSLAQEGWNQIATAPGFLAQFGGWDLRDSNSACVLSIWKDRPSFEHFMHNIHDALTEFNQQSGTYSELQIDFFEPKLNMPGKYLDLIQALPNAKYLRIADCQVKVDRLSNFHKSQKEIWIPAISKSKGMLGGTFQQGSQNTTRHLVTTLWESEERHRDYATHQYPLLKEQANAAMDLVSVVGRFIELEDDWTITALMP